MCGAGAESFHDAFLISVDLLLNRILGIHKHLDYSRTLSLRRTRDTVDVPRWEPLKQAYMIMRSYRYLAFSSQGSETCEAL